MEFYVHMKTRGCSPRGLRVGERKSVEKVLLFLSQTMIQLFWVICIVLEIEYMLYSIYKLTKGVQAQTWAVVPSRHLYGRRERSVCRIDMPSEPRMI